MQKYFIIFLFLLVAYVSSDTTTEPITSRKCYKCPHGIRPGQNCLTDPDDLGIEEECRGDKDGLFNGCETIIVEDEAASIKYNRRCAHVGVLPPDHTAKCHDDEIEIQGEGTFKGKRCFC